MNADCALGDHLLELKRGIDDPFCSLPWYRIEDGRGRSEGREAELRGRGGKGGRAGCTPRHGTHVEAAYQPFSQLQRQAMPWSKPGWHGAFEGTKQSLQDWRARGQPEHRVVDYTRPLLPEEILGFAVKWLDEIHVGVDPGAEAALQQLVAKPIGKRRDAAVTMPDDGALRQDFRGVANLDPFRNSYRLAVTVKAERMTLSKDRPKARPFHGAEPVADPQGQAMKHRTAMAMRSIPVSPAAGAARAWWSSPRA